MSAPCWQELGIDETNDARAIRKAYARRLKTIDADTDPASFIRLREALEEALDRAAWAVEEEEWRRSHPEEEAAATAGDQAETDAGFAPGDEDALEEDWLYPWRGSRFRPVFHAPPAELSESEEFAVLAELDRILLDADPDNPPEPEELTARTRRILGEPAMERIDHATRVEEWLARLIVDTMPHSDPVAAAAVAYFGWDREDGRWDQNWDIQAILERRRALRVVARVSNPKHRYHRAWLELTSDRLKLPANYFFIRTDVRDFLYGVRERTPLVEDFFNANQVHLWDEHFGDPNRGRSWSRIGLGFALLWGGLQLIRLFAS